MVESWSRNLAAASNCSAFGGGHHARGQRALQLGVAAFQQQSCASRTALA
jgi:hypothetical protein